ncbi:hypothetical protein LCGC14_0916120 [marine sediment metagenome]|uniref:Uncharacterized protein n=1 Tax=marine sediment metagenome TaxID=412755 RepID=A0A0F9RAZ6_9ZZZZ
MAKKEKIPKGSMRLPILVFELGDLYKLVEECQRKKEYALAFALQRIHDRILEKRKNLTYK